jgi:hypothetical protein
MNFHDLIRNNPFSEYFRIINLIEADIGHYIAISKEPEFLKWLEEPSKRLNTTPKWMADQFIRYGLGLCNGSGSDNTHYDRVKEQFLIIASEAASKKDLESKVSGGYAAKSA